MNRKYFPIFRKITSLIILLALLLSAAGPVSTVKADDPPPPDTGTPAATEGDDVITGGPGDSTINALGGDDVVNGGEGDDVIDGGEGNDILDGGPGDDVIDGGPGDDTITGGPGEDILDGAEGTDTLLEVMVEDFVTTGGELPPEEIPAGIYYECLSGDCGSPSIGATRKNTIVIPYGEPIQGSYEQTSTSSTNLDMTLTDEVLTTISEDSIVSEVIETTERASVILIYEQVYEESCGLFGCRTRWVTQSVSGNWGGTSITHTGTSTDLQITSSEEIDEHFNFEAANLTGNSRDNTLDASAFSRGDDTLYGLGGNDTLRGGSGNDYLYGGDGDDEMYGGAGDDTMDGNAGDDEMYGGAGDDTMDGGDGDDWMEGGDGDDWMEGGDGNDWLDGDDGDDTLRGGDGTDTLLGGSGNDSLYGGADDDILYGDGGNDSIDGGSGDDMLFGGAGSDGMNGGDGDDSLDGGAGDDVMDGGNGNDILTGATGNDTLYSSPGMDNLDGGDDDDTIIISGENGLGEGQETYATGGTGMNYFLFMAGAYGDLELESQGEDTLDFSSYDRGVTVDMSRTDRQEVASWEEDDGDTTVVRSLWLTLKGLFTNLIGSNQADTLIGNDLDNNIEGRGGDDLLSGGAGVDNLYGGDRTSALNSVDTSDGLDTDLDAVAVPGGVDHEDNWHSIELPEPLPTPAPVPPGGGGEAGPAAIGNLLIPVTGNLVQLECAGSPFRIFTLQLPSGDYARITGLCQEDPDYYYWAILAQEAAGTLPEALPSEPEPVNFGAGMTLSLFDGVDTTDLTPMETLPDGGWIDYSFVIRPEMEGKPMMAMFWDVWTENGVLAGDWSQVPDYAEENGVPVTTEIHPDVEDGLMVLSGARVVNGRMEVSTNFIGTFLEVTQ